MTATIEIHAVSETGFDLASGIVSVTFRKNKMFVPFVNGALRWVSRRVQLSKVSVIQVSWRTPAGVYRSFTIDPSRNVVSFPAAS